MRIRHIDDDLNRLLASIPADYDDHGKKWIESRLQEDDRYPRLAGDMGIENFWKVLCFCHRIATTPARPRRNKKDMLKIANDASRVAKDIRREHGKKAFGLASKVERHAEWAALEAFRETVIPYMFIYQPGRGDRADVRRAFFVSILTDNFMKTFGKPNYDWTATLFGMVFGDDPNGISARRIEGIYRRAFGHAPSLTSKTRKPFPLDKEIPPGRPGCSSRSEALRGLPLAVGTRIRLCAVDPRCGGGHFGRSRHSGGSAI